MNNYDNWRTRALTVFDARRHGQTLEQIAKQYGISRERARQLAIRGERIEYEITTDDPWFELRPRTRNALTNDGCYPTIQGVVFRYQTVKDLKKVISMGNKGIADLQAWLVRHGKDPLP